MSTSQDTEITLGTGKLLLLFFGLVALCAVFFAFGYNLGRSATTPALAERTPPAAETSKAGTKSGAPNTAKNSDLTFYKAVAQNETNPQLAPAQPAASSASAGDSASPAPPPTEPQTTTLPSASSYYVQVAAVTKQEDADALVEALKKKQYPAFTASGVSTDKLFHVQVGPYGDVKDAEIMRAKLISDGYNPILKK